jgi:hypothetical protein
LDDKYQCTAARRVLFCSRSNREKFQWAASERVETATFF